MGVLLISLALIGGLIKGFSGKGISRDVESLSDGFTVNIIRSCFCTVISLAILLISAGPSALALDGASLVVCLASSVFMCVFAVAWLYAYKSEAYVFLSVFTMLGSVLTALLSHFIYGDELKITRIIGMAVLFVAVYITSLYNKNIKGKMTTKGVITLILGASGAALADFMQKVFTKEGLGSAYAFNFYTYALMLLPQLILLLIIFYCRARRSPKRLTAGDLLNKKLFDRRHVIICAMIAVGLYLNSLSKTLATEYVPSTQLYPTLQALNLIASAILAAILFKEKITAKSAIGISVALGAVLLMNI